MKSRLTLLLLLLGLIGLSQQTSTPPLPRSAVDITGGAWVAGAHSNYAFESGGSAGVDFGLAYAFCFKNNFGLGFNLDFLKPATNNPNDTSQTGRLYADMKRIGISFQYCLVRKPRFNYYVATIHQVGSFSILNRDTSGTEAELYLEGFNIALATGFRWYFSKNVGLTGSLSWQLQSYQVREYHVNGELKEELNNAPARDVFINLRGINLRLGLTVQF